MQSPFNPQTLNRYSYCNNNPINLVDPSGHSWKSFFKAAAIAVVGAALTIATGGAMAAMGFAAGGFWSSIAVGAVAGATIGGTVAAATGGNIGQGMLTGAISGAIFGGIGSFNLSGWSQVGAHFVGGLASGGINAAITGGDIGQGALISGISAGVTAWAGNIAPDIFNAKGDWGYTKSLAARSALGGLIGGGVAASQGGQFMAGFKAGATTAAISYTTNCAMHLGGALYGMISGGVGGALSGSAVAYAQGKSPFWGGVRGAFVGGLVGGAVGLFFPGANNLGALPNLVKALAVVGIGGASSAAGQVAGGYWEGDASSYQHINYGAVAGAAVGSLGGPVLEACYATPMQAALFGGAYSGYMEAAGDVMAEQH